MTGGIIGAAEWFFDCVLLVVMIATLIYARRLDRLLRQVRSDRAALQMLLGQIAGSVTAVVAATERLKVESNATSARIASACTTAGQMTKTLENLVGCAGEVARSRPETRTPPRSSPHATKRSTAGLTSRTERDLARMLADAS